MVILTFTSSCLKDEIIDSSNAILSFSSDTVSFDTVFTETGSATMAFKVYNRYNGTLRISSVRLAGSGSSFFRLNIDGESTVTAENIELPAGDSLFVFVDVYVNPLNVNNPVFIKDSVVFETNGNIQDVKLLAYGQDVWLLEGDTLDTRTWTDDKPYLVKGLVIVDTGQVLTIDAGCDIYFYKNSSLHVSGSLIVNGTGENPVKMQHSRNEDYFDFLPGQWGTVYLAPESSGNIINHAIIKNSTTGIQAGSPAVAEGPDLMLANSQIMNTSYAGLYASGAKVSCSNTVFSGSAGPLLAINNGGNYSFVHCTFSNNGVTGTSRSEPSVSLSNFIYAETVNPVTGIAEFALVKGDLDSALFINSIIYGSYTREIELNDIDDGSTLFNYHFGNCLVKIPESLPELEEPDRFVNTIFNDDPEFINSVKNPPDLRLDTLSPAKDAGDPSVFVRWPLTVKDIDGIPRNTDAGPDLGSYERIEE